VGETEGSGNARTPPTDCAKPKKGSEVSNLTAMTAPDRGSKQWRKFAPAGYPRGNGSSIEKGCKNGRMSALGW
jgi:hypothetical protein